EDVRAGAHVGGAVHRPGVGDRIVAGAKRDVAGQRPAIVDGRVAGRADVTGDGPGVEKVKRPTGGADVAGDGAAGAEVVDRIGLAGSRSAEIDVAGDRTGPARRIVHRAPAAE